MKLTLFKDAICVREIRNVKGFTKCSTGDIVIILEDNTQFNVYKEEYDFFGGDE